jgi:hypothetical protein
VTRVVTARDATSGNMIVLSETNWPPTDWLSARPTDWPINWLTEWLADWLTDRLAGWANNYLTTFFVLDFIIYYF